MSKLYIFWKRLLSYRKQTWELSDYPIEVREQGSSAPDIPKYKVMIPEWILMGFGETEEEARSNLKKNFDKFLEDRPGEVPRPGTMMPAESYLASHKGVDIHRETADKFIRLVLDFDPDFLFFFSDESTLADFVRPGNSAEEFIARAQKAFGVDITDIADGNILQILDRIDAAIDISQVVGGGSGRTE